MIACITLNFTLDLVFTFPILAFYKNGLHNTHVKMSLKILKCCPLQKNLFLYYSIFLLLMVYK